MTKFKHYVLGTSVLAGLTLATLATPAFADAILNGSQEARERRRQLIDPFAQHNVADAEIGPGDAHAQPHQAAGAHAEEAPVAGRVLVRELALDLPLREARDAFERTYFEHHLLREQGSMTRVAERTGLERTHLYRKLKQLGVDLSKSKKGA